MPTDLIATYGFTPEELAELAELIAVEEWPPRREPAMADANG